LVIDKVLNMFYNKRELIKDKSTVIIRKLSSFLDAEKLFVTLASNLLKYKVTYLINLLTSL